MDCTSNSDSTRRPGRIATLAIGALVLSSFLSCYEDLPPFEEPVQVEGVSLHFNLANGGLVTLDANNQPKGSIGALDIRVTNLYSEYLSDTARVEVTIEIYVKDQPDKNAVVTMSADDVWTSGVLFNGILTIEPQHQVRIMKTWPHRTTQGDPLVNYTDEPTGVQIDVAGKVFTAFPVHLMVSASVKVFKNRPTLYMPADRKTSTEYILYYTWG